MTTYYAIETGREADRPRMLHLFADHRVDSDRTRCGRATENCVSVALAPASDVLCEECQADGDQGEADGLTYRSRGARMLRANISGRIVWSPERGWHDGEAVDS